MEREKEKALQKCHPAACILPPLCKEQLLLAAVIFIPVNANLNY